MYYEAVFTIIERDPKYIRNLANVCMNNFSNNKVELMFYEYLKNPIAEELTFEPESGSAFEDRIIASAKLEKDELEYMESISVRYEALDKFKPTLSS